MVLPFRLSKLPDETCFGILLLSSWEIWILVCAVQVVMAQVAVLSPPPDQPLPQRRPRHAIILYTCDTYLLFCLIHLFLLTTYRTTRGMFMKTINLN